MTEPFILQGRRIGALELAQVRQLLADHPEWHRKRLSVELATAWNWRNAAGRLKDMAARTFLLKLEKRGSITLPPRRWARPSREGARRPPEPELPFLQEPVEERLGALLPLVLTEVSAIPGTPPRLLFEALLRQHHYLSYRRPVGENLQYLVLDRQGRAVACVLWGAAAWQCASRDQFIGWDGAARAQQLHLLANNARFLIPPWVRCAGLASHVLSRVARQVSGDWQRKYGHPIYLLETFVQTDRFVGAGYQGANWARAGQTKGRSRQDRADGSHNQVPIKDVYLYPLHPDFRSLLQGSAPTIQNSKHAKPSLTP